jgi:hypothetical protein
MNDEELAAVDEWFRRLGLDEEATEAITLVGNTRYWGEITHPPFEHHWDTTLPHFWSDDELWDCEPFVGEEWMRYDPREGF